MLPPTKIRELFGPIDIYLFDQILRGNIQPGMRVMDVGCGGGRNLHYLMRAGFEVQGLDPNPEAIEQVRGLARKLAPHLAPNAFRVETMENSTFPDTCAEVVLCNAVLHFSRDTAHFDAQVLGAWRLLAPDGLFFCRLASSISVEDQVTPRGSGRFVQGDGHERYLVNQNQLLATTARLNAQLVDPIKTTNVQGLRAMTTWVLRKPHSLL